MKYELEQIGLGLMFYGNMIDNTALALIENRAKDIHQLVYKINQRVHYINVFSHYNFI